MAKKALLYLPAVILLIAVMCVGLVACNNTENYSKTIVYLGDSIAEALLGPSPVAERDNYGYYALIGKMNNFRYYNHSVSGHKTSGGPSGGIGLLEMVERDSEDATLMKTHLQQADIIHISIMGNNVLQSNVGLLLLEVADPEFEVKYEQGTTLLNALHDGTDQPIYRPSINGSGSVKFQFPPTYDDICNIVARLKALNPRATIIFQKVYNPFFEGSTLMNQAVKNKLATIIDDGRFGHEGRPINTTEQFRAVAQALLDNVNGILDEYLEKHRAMGQPDDFVILDVGKEFERFTEMDVKEDGSINLGGDSFGRSLIFNDWVHPSNIGHAVITIATQRLLEELGLASDGATNVYKSIRISQLNRLYNNVIPDKNSVIKDILKDRSIEDVTMTYFNAIAGYTPENY